MLMLPSEIIWVLTIGFTYPPIIAAFVIDFRKVRPLTKGNQRQNSGSKSPKQLKHEQEAKERAEAIEAARKVAKEAKRSRPSRKAKDTIVPGDEQ
jgi:hypothetical protein